MIGGFVNNDPIDHSKLYRDLKVVNYFEDAGWTRYFHNLDGYHEALTQLRNFKKDNENIASTKVRGVEIKLNQDVMSMVTKLPKGMNWNKDDRELAQKDKNYFLGLQRNMKKRKEF